MESKSALVTGASRGIGSAIAEKLADQGFFVIGTATTAAGAEQISKDLGDRGCGLKLLVQDQHSVEAMVEELATLEVGSPLILVNNAAITRDNLMLRMSAEEWQDVVDTNLSGAFRVTKALLRNMVKARWGRIINVGSVVGRLGNPGQANYVASKAGLEGFTRSLALEVASRGITVNLLAPGLIETDMTAELTNEQRDAMLTRIPLGRMGQANDVAAAAAFLSSDDGAYITGQTLHINGGMFLS
ncbi:MAG: 3-oxoacyl-ACP reductase FabG [Pseudomonadota bacterium]|nr:3-oxoacyl-ACP reductase FabG [Pseudomonadota bacterium]MEC7414526.1 3-oxoacyl-ACP reductase FabG [Pseudomonadota bacterium]MEC7419578.1 3-oxoacyl-ACP reductase FabG [Pseudomonadota bacterium]MEC7553208.1 3-oxoacyl-ACP reductase FabG [Pseudomonadota bacterium]MEC8696018.1 3-oxoacyl-ACP reductase FabG [Pseudomonadota bacterium]